MPRKKATTTAAARRRVTTTEIEEPDYVQIEDPFERVRAQFGDSVGRGEVRITILRAKAHGAAEPEYLASYDFDEAIHTPDWIREEFGAGKYILRFLDRETREQWSKTFPIGELPGARRYGESSENEMTKLLREQNEKFLQGMLGKGGASSNPEADPVVIMMREQAALNRTLLELMMNRPDPTQLFLNGAEKVFEVVSNMKAESNGDWVSILPKILKEVGPALHTIARAPGAPPMMPPAALPAPPPPPGANVQLSSSRMRLPASGPSSAGDGFTRTGPGNNPGSPVAPVSDIVEQPIRLGELVRSYAPQILEAASSNTHPGIVANGILDSVPAMFHETLGTIEPEDLIAAEPGLQSYKPWIERMVNFVRSGGFDEPEPEAEA